MKAAEIQEYGGSLILTNKEIPIPGKNQVRVKVYACGVCRLEEMAKFGEYEKKFPIVPGHEIAGIVDEIGPGVTKFQKGEKVGVGWFGGACGECLACRQMQLILCPQLKKTGINADGGYAEYTLVHETALARIPKALNWNEAAPLMCGGVTAFNALRHTKASPGDVVAVLGLGGLGHLAIQFASKMGFYTIAMSSNDEKRDLAMKLGAQHFMNALDLNQVASELNRIGGAKLILVCVPNSTVVEPLIHALSIGGEIMILALLKESVSFDPLALEMKRATIKGFPSGDPRDIEDCLKFAAMTGVRPIIETLPLEKAQTALDNMMNSKCRCKAVLTISHD